MGRKTIRAIIDTAPVVRQKPSPPSMVILFGSGVVFSYLVQKNIPIKNAKYRKVHIWANIVLAGVGAFIPKYPSIKKAAGKIKIAILLIRPLYLIERTGLLSSHGRINKIATAAAITIKPPNLSGTALNIE